MIRQSLERYKTASYIYLKLASPIRTGELRNSIKVVSHPLGWEFRITAPHTVYTEERWKHPRWRWQNPNLYWIRKAVKQSLTRYASQYGGRLYVSESD